MSHRRWKLTALPWGSVEFIFKLFQTSKLCVGSSKVARAPYSRYTQVYNFHWHLIHHQKYFLLLRFIESSSENSPHLILYNNPQNKLRAAEGLCRSLVLQGNLRSSWRSGPRRSRWCGGGRRPAAARRPGGPGRSPEETPQLRSASGHIKLSQLKQKAARLRAN